MDNQEELSLALSFMTQHPQAAVKVLEQCDARAVASLLASAPVNYITPVLKYILPEYAARICDLLDPEKAGSILSTLDANAISIILRLMARERQQSVLEAMPAALRTRTQLLLDFPVNHVGAWMSPHMLVIANDMKNKNVLKYLKAGSNLDDSEYLFITKRDGELMGKTRLLDIVRSTEDMPVTTSMKPTPSIQAQMLLDQVKHHRAWEDADIIPVTDTNKRLLGILQHHALRKGLDQVQTKRKKPVRGKDPVSGILEVYGQSLLAVFNSVSDAMEKDY